MAQKFSDIQLMPTIRAHFGLPYLPPTYEAYPYGVEEETSNGWQIEWRGNEKWTTNISMLRTPQGWGEVQELLIRNESKLIRVCFKNNKQFGEKYIEIPMESLDDLLSALLKYAPMGGDAYVDWGMKMALEQEEEIRAAVKQLEEMKRLRREKDTEIARRAHAAFWQYVNEHAAEVKAHIFERAIADFPNEDVALRAAIDKNFQASSRTPWRHLPDT